MATFDVVKDGSKTKYRFKIKNHTSNTPVIFNYNALLFGEFVSSIEGGGLSGTVEPGKDVTTSFKVRFDITPLFFKPTVSILNVNGVDLKMKFWTGSNDQYVNWIDTGAFTTNDPSNDDYESDQWIAAGNYVVTKNDSEMNRMENNQYKVTIDGGGHDQDTKHIYLQIYDQ